MKRFLFEDSGLTLGFMTSLMHEPFVLSLRLSAGPVQPSTYMRICQNLAHERDS